jgi:hypothetical protein
MSQLGTMEKRWILLIAGIELQFICYPAVTVVTMLTKLLRSSKKNQLDAQSLLKILIVVLL